VTCSGAADPDYAISYAAGVLTVSPANLTVTAPSPTMLAGASVPSLVPSYSGFENGDSPGSLTTVATCSTTATSDSPPGTYPVACSGAADPNYDIGYAGGSLTVAPSVSLTFTGALTYANFAPISSGSINVAPATGTVESVTGTITFPGVNGGVATMSVHIKRLFGLYIGGITVSDPSAHLRTTAIVLTPRLSRLPTGQVAGTASGFSSRQLYRLNFTV
jgi:hypothetical protein